uniref:Uncharacterized protein n=1 Tax=Kuenenia stuttgartiensis TaxID=174633 RepID=Q1PY94_KUEST|nr:unknown protein [Candidatus Kuenenia stuttgartiensis]
MSSNRLYTPPLRLRQAVLLLEFFKKIKCYAFFTFFKGLKCYEISLTINKINTPITRTSTGSKSIQS